MGKGKHSLPGKAAFERISFLYQAANLSLSSGKGGKAISGYYSALATAVARKSVQRLEPLVKRCICKGCGGLLEAGITARVRLRRGNIIVSCLVCHSIRRFPTRRDYCPWFFQPDSVVETIDFDKRSQQKATEASSEDEGNKRHLLNCFLLK